MRKDTERCLERYSVNIFMNKKTIEAAEAMIGQNEIIHYIAPSNMKVTPRNTARGKVYTGAIVITDAKIYIYHKAGWDSGIEIFNICDLVRVSYTANGMTAAEFTLTMQDASINFIASYDKASATALHEKLNTLICQRANAVPSPAADPVSEIKRYKELLDIGAITQDEFDTKKKQLLGI